MASTSYPPESTGGVTQSQIVNDSPNGDLATDTKIGIVVGLVLFVILLLGFYLVANMSRWRRADAESGLSAGSHAATDNHVNCFRRWRKSSSVYSLYDASLHSESYTQHSGGSQGRALPLERQPTHKADRRHSKSSVSTFSVTSAKSADGYITEREGQVGAPSPPEPVMHRARTSHVSHAYGPSS